MGDCFGTISIALDKRKNYEHFYYEQIQGSRSFITQT